MSHQTQTLFSHMHSFPLTHTHTRTTPTSTSARTAAAPVLCLRGERQQEASLYLPAIKSSGPRPAGRSQPIRGRAREARRPMENARLPAPSSHCAPFREMSGRAQQRRVGGGARFPGQRSIPGSAFHCAPGARGGLPRSCLQCLLSPLLSVPLPQSGSS